MYFLLQVLVSCGYFVDEIFYSLDSEIVDEDLCSQNVIWQPRTILVTIDERRFFTIYSGNEKRGPRSVQF